MFGDGEWSYDGTSWLDDPTDYFRAWDEAHALIRAELGDVRISGPNTSLLFDQVEGFLEHTVEAGTVPDVITWHELSHPDQIRGSVERYRGWEAEIFAEPTTGTELRSTSRVRVQLPHVRTRTDGPMDVGDRGIRSAMIAFWNINGNLSDSAVQANQALPVNGSQATREQWPHRRYPHGETTLQGMATSTGTSTGPHTPGRIRRCGTRTVPERLGAVGLGPPGSGNPWTGQIGDSAPDCYREVLEIGPAPSPSFRRHPAALANPPLRDRIPGRGQTPGESPTTGRDRSRPGPTTPAVDTASSLGFAGTCQVLHLRRLRRRRSAHRVDGVLDSPSTCRAGTYDLSVRQFPVHLAWSRNRDRPTSS